MRKLLIISIVLLSVTSMYGQQENLYTNYRFNTFMFNPAAAGMEGQWSAGASYRSEWTRFPGAPVTTTIKFDGVLGNRSGVGVNFISDILGPENNWGFQGAYAYHIPLESANLALGLGVRAMNFSLDPSKTKTVVQPDPTVAELFEDEWLTDFAFGAFLYNRKYFVGVSAPKVVQVMGDEARELVPHIYALGGYKFKLGATSTLEPSVLLKYADNFQYEIQLRAWLLEEQLLIGAGFRDPGFVSVITGFDVKDRYQFSYSYDFSIQEFQAYSWGSHEVTFGIKFGKQKFNHLAEHNLERKDQSEEEMEDEEMEMEDEGEMDEEEEEEE